MMMSLEKVPKPPRKPLKFSYNKKKKVKQSAEEGTLIKSELSLSNGHDNTFDPIVNILERLDLASENLHRAFNSKLDSLFEFTNNLEMTAIPFQSKHKRTQNNEMNIEEESFLEKILKKPKTNTFLDYNFCLKNNVYLDNMLKLNVENTVLNEVSLCEETAVSEKENPAINNKNNEKSVIYLYKSNYPNEKQVCIEITKSDLDKVPDNLLNDNIILFYLKLIHNEMIDQDTHHRSYIFNTYFYQKFFMSLNNLVVTQLSDKDYEKGFNAIKKVKFFYFYFLIEIIHSFISWIIFFCRKFF